MLLSLSIRDVVLIDRLGATLEPGLSVLTGETGAGKSILLDSLGLVLGARGDTGLLRRGASQLAVAAEFDLARDHPARSLLDEHGISGDGSTIVVRRVIGADGRSRAAVDDQPVSVGLLKRLGQLLVEIHGQFESHGLLDPATHLGALDAFGGLETDAAGVAAAWAEWRAATEERRAAEAALAEDRKEEEWLRAMVAELDGLNPRPGEEIALAERRALLMNGEKLLEGLDGAYQALTRDGRVEAALQTARKTLERIADKAEGRVEPILAALDRATDEVADAAGLLEKASADVDLDPLHLERVEERLFALRAAARKHGVEVDGLDGLRQDFAERLAALDNGGEAVGRLAAAERAARSRYVEAARTLGRKRAAAAERLDAAVAGELPPLKLDKATFRTRIQPLDEPQWRESGVDAVSFAVSTNPGQAPGPLGRIVSGGELARFMLALKVVLARVQRVPTIVFDEVDSGVGGAVAAAVGERLARLAREVQVLVVTHSPQVAARADHHWRVTKEDAPGGGPPVTRLEALSDEARREEIARMLAGARVTDEARAAADSLLGA